MPARWKHRPPGSNWGEFGPDDQRGRMNYVTPAKVLQGIAEVREGRTFCLSLPLDYPGGRVLNPRRGPPRLAPTMRGEQANYNFALAEIDPLLTDVVCDDLVLLSLQYSTQWDSFAHVGSRFDVDGTGEPALVFYNGFRAGEDIQRAAETPGAEPWARFEGSRAGALGIEQLAEHGAQGRGVLIDLHAHVGRARTAIGYDALMRILERDRVVVEHGDHPGRRAPLDAARADAAARALPVQEWHPPRRALVSHRARRLPPRTWPQPVLAHRAAAPLAGRRRLAGRRGRDGVRYARARPREATT